MTYDEQIQRGEAVIARLENVIGRARVALDARRRLTADSVRRLTKAESDAMRAQFLGDATEVEVDLASVIPGYARIGGPVR